MYLNFGDDGAFRTLAQPADIPTHQTSKSYRVKSFLPDEQIWLRGWGGRPSCSFLGLLNTLISKNGQKSKELGTGKAPLGWRTGEA